MTTPFPEEALQSGTSSQTKGKERISGVICTTRMTASVPLESPPPVEDKLEAYCSVCFMVHLFPHRVLDLP